MPANRNRQVSSSLVLWVGIACIIFGLCIVGFIYIPIAKQEVSYSLRTIENKPPLAIKPIDTTLGIVIPKIDANASIIPNVDPNDASAYQLALTRGVAHAKGTVLPGQVGNSFIFSHSSENIFEANRYNSIFYLLTKLEKGDEILIYVKGTKYTYSVDSTKIISANEISYLTNTSAKKQITLMTCWPAGTNFKRYIVIATIKE